MDLANRCYSSGVATNIFECFYALYLCQAPGSLKDAGSLERWDSDAAQCYRNIKVTVKFEWKSLGKYPSL